MKAKIQSNNSINCSISNGKQINCSTNIKSDINANPQAQSEICAGSTQRGLQGIPGEAATIQLGTVSTGEAGTDVIITNSGTENAAIFNFTIPRGDAGQDGAAGEIVGATATINNNIGIPSVNVTAGGTSIARTFNFAFENLKGNTGNGITSIVKTSSSGLVDTYTITYDNGNTQTFTVTNGQDGAAATIAVGSVTTGAAGSDAEVTNVGTSNAAIFDFVIPKGDTGETGATGAQGVSVTGVSLISTVGLDKTYRMTFSNNTYYDYVVSDGAAGSTTWGGITGVLSNQNDLQTALNDKQDVLTAGTDLEITQNNTINFTNDSKYIKNTATGTNSITVNGTATSSLQAINIGKGSSATKNNTVALGYNASAAGSSSVAIGNSAGASTAGISGVAIGDGAKSQAQYAIQLGKGTNTVASTLSIGFGSTNYTLLNGSTGFIPNGRLSTSIARTSDIPTATTVAGWGFITGIDGTDVTTALGYTPYDNSNPDGYLKNTATGLNSFAVGGIATGDRALSFGGVASGDNSIAIGVPLSGYNAEVTASDAIQLGKGTNNTATSFNVGFFNNNYQMLDGTTGLIPDARISSNIARSSAIPTATSELTNDSGFIDSSDLTDVIVPISYTSGTSSGTNVNNGTYWVIRYSNGWVRQGGHYTAASTTNITINLPVTMANANYSWNAGYETSSSNMYGQSTAKTTTSITLKCYKNVGMSWMVEGMESIA